MFDWVHFDYFRIRSMSSIVWMVKLEPYDASVAWMPIERSAYLNAMRSLAPSPHIPIFVFLVLKNLVNLEYLVLIY